MFLTSGSSFSKVYPRKGFDRALARFAQNLEAGLNNLGKRLTLDQGTQTSQINKNKNCSNSFPERSVVLSDFYQ